MAGRHARRVLLWLLIVIVAAGALVGFRFLTRGTAVEHVTHVGTDASVVSPGDAAFPNAVAVLTGTPLLAGNRVEVALNGDETFPRLWSDLRSARQSITIQLYYAQPGRVADTLAAILIDRVRAGVRVHFLIDAFGSDLPSGFAERLSSAGVHFAFFRPVRLRNLWMVQNRLHVRGFVIDGRVGWTGGFGIADKWLGDGRRLDQWRETNARFEGPAVRQLQSAFIAGWTEATGELLLVGREWAEASVAGKATAGVLYAVPSLGSTPAERYLALSIASARRTLYLTNAYFAPDSTFVALLVHAARRGVDVRVLVGGPNTDVRTARLAARARYEILLTAGVRVYEYLPTTLHAKTFVADGRWVSIGTMNFDNRSLSLNEESTLMILDSTIGKQMDAVFVEDLRFARQIDLASFRRRSWIERMGEWVANQIATFL